MILAEKSAGADSRNGIKPFLIFDFRFPIAHVSPKPGETWATRYGESMYIWLFRHAAAQWLARKRPSSERSGSGRLSPREQLVFTLKARQNLSLRTVAQILDIPEHVAARTFSHAVLKLRNSAEAAATQSTINTKPDVVDGKPSDKGHGLRGNHCSMHNCR